MHTSRKDLENMPMSRHTADENPAFVAADDSEPTLLQLNELYHELKGYLTVLRHSCPMLTQQNDRNTVPTPRNTRRFDR